MTREMLLVFAAMALAVFVGRPLAVFAHEAGHALAAFVCTRARVHIVLGEGPELLERACGRLQLTLRRGWIMAGTCTYEADMVGPAARATIAMAGPLVTLLGLIGALLVSFSTGGVPWRACAAVCAAVHARVLYRATVGPASDRVAWTSALRARRAR